MTLKHFLQKNWDLTLLQKIRQYDISRVAIPLPRQNSLLVFESFLQFLRSNLIDNLGSLNTVSCYHNCCRAV